MQPYLRVCGCTEYSREYFPKDPSPLTAAPLKYSEFMGLNINNSIPQSRFDVFEEPPPPMISSEGIIAQDITQKFLSAAASRYSRTSVPRPMLTAATTRNSLGARRAGQGWLLYSV